MEFVIAVAIVIGAMGYGFHEGRRFERHDWENDLKDLVGRGTVKHG